ncbi:MAG: hypothetical protein WCN88_03180 [Candidatus Falkowbacteria bacterium]
MGLPILKNRVKDTFKSINKQNTKKLLKDPIFWARFLGYALPLGFLLYVLYINFLPFGYHKTFIINVGSANDTTVSEFYLEPSQDLSGRKTNPDGTTYRELTGMATAVFKPNVVLKDAEITVEVEGEGVSLIPPYLDFDPNSVQWDKSWDFTKGVPGDLVNKNKKAFLFDGATYLDGTARLEIASSSDMFEDGAFTVYAEWLPTDDSSDGQQIVGHYNWELWQNKESVSFQIGRVNNKDGQFYNIKIPIDKKFFNKKHSLMAIYFSSDINGYIELFVDGQFSVRAYLGPDKIWTDYNGKNDLSFGWTSHNYGTSPYFRGNLYKVNIISKNIFLPQTKIKFKTENSESLTIFFRSNLPTASIIKQIKLDAVQK